jgi:hypothetical protein
MADHLNPPILNHPVEEPSVFTPGDLMDDVRKAREIPEASTNTE